LSSQENIVNFQSIDAPGRASLYRTIWRWHFYAGLLVLPFILILSVTGAAYLFKPQIDRWEERGFHGGTVEAAVSPNSQLLAAMRAFPDAQFHSYRLPENPGDAAMLHLAMADGKSMRDVFVSPQGKVLGSLDPEARIAPTLAHIHGSLMIGKLGDWLVELAASWAIVMIVTGLYLWWPDGTGLAGVLWPRLGLGKRAFWRDLHAVTGFWISGLALLLLLTGLPWASVWGEAFQMARAELGLVQGPRDWKAGAASPHAGHDHEAMLRQQAAGVPLASLADMVVKAKAERMAFPVLVLPPGAPQRFGPPIDMAWMIKSEAQNRPLVRSVTFDAATGKELTRKGFADKHVIDRVVNYGIAWHEGQLFGWINQLIGVFTALGLVTLAVSGFVMWRRRKPEGALGAPPLPAVPLRMRGVVAIMLALAALLPLLAASLILLWLFDRVVLPRLPGLASWLGVAKAQPV
jgi:uncharacterized iron-regulated membrane protein